MTQKIFKQVLSKATREADQFISTDTQRAIIWAGKRIKELEGRQTSVRPKINT
jgi:hypothetical protein